MPSDRDTAAAAATSKPALDPSSLASPSPRMPGGLPLAPLQFKKLQVAGDDAAPREKGEKAPLGGDADEDDVEGLLSPSMEASQLVDQEALHLSPQPGASSGLGLDVAPTSPTKGEVATGEAPSPPQSTAPSTDASGDASHPTFPSTPTTLPLPLSPPHTPSTPTSQHPTSSTPNHSAYSLPTAPMPPANDATPRYSIPNRRPAGWISSLPGPRVLSDRIASTGKAAPPRAASAAMGSAVGKGRPGQGKGQGQGGGGGMPRVASVHSQSGRRVSGAMQYALAPGDRVTSHASQASDGPLDSGFDLTAAAAEPLHNNGEPGPEGGEEGEAEEVEEEEEERIRFEVSTAQEQDEVWMAFVRQQLGALFPDFFSADPEELGGYAASAGIHEADEDEGAGQYADTGAQEEAGETNQRGTRRNVSVASTSAQLQDPLSPSQDTSYTSTAEEASLATPPPTCRPSFGMGAGMGGVVGGMVPNVREEISGLREEIMRLRSVVGGLAQGLGREIEEGQRALEEQAEEGQVVEGRDEERDEEEHEEGDAVELESAQVEVHAAAAAEEKNRDEVAAAGVNKEEEVPVAFKETASLSASIIRTLDCLVNPASKLARVDADVFAEANLEAIKKYVAGLGVVDDKAGA
ncbi:hypothetical protein IAT38_006594 [Cryptococcus sp. DSM 104549]